MGIVAERRKIMWKKIMGGLLALLFLLPCGCGRKAADPLKETAEYLQQAVPQPALGSVGGEWLILGLSRWEGELPAEYVQGYLQRLEQTLQEKNGVLSSRKYTEYSRVILALTALGQDPAAFAGYDLLKPLADYQQVLVQGLNGPVFALLALDSGDYPLPQDPEITEQASREKYVEYILSRQEADGGWGLSQGASDVDMTAMTLQALAKYAQRSDAAQAIEGGLTWLSAQQQESGGFVSYGAENSESIVQVIVALGELGVSIEDPRFVKNGHDLAEALAQFRQEDGSYSHALGQGTDQMASEQAFYALVSLQRQKQGKSSFYRMK